MRISGLVEFGAVSSIGGATLAGFDLPTAQRLFDKTGKLDQILIAEEGRDSRAATASTRSGRSCRPAPRSAPPTTRPTRTPTAPVGFLDFFRTFLLVFGGIALFVGSFVIANSLSITIAQRTREFATLRTLGASRRQVLGSVVLEALVTGLVAAVAGLFLGLGIATGLFKLFDAVGLHAAQQRTGVPDPHDRCRAARRRTGHRCWPACDRPGERPGCHRSRRSGKARRSPRAGSTGSGRSVPRCSRSPASRWWSSDCSSTGSARPRVLALAGGRGAADLHRHRPVLCTVGATAGGGVGSDRALVGRRSDRAGLAVLLVAVLVATPWLLGPGARSPYGGFVLGAVLNPVLLVIVALMAVRRRSARGSPSGPRTSPAYSRTGRRPDRRAEQPARSTPDGVDRGGADDRAGAGHAGRDAGRGHHQAVRGRGRQDLQRRLRDHRAEQLQPAAADGRGGGRGRAGGARRSPACVVGRRRRSTRRSSITAVDTQAPDGAHLRLEERIAGRPRRTGRRRRHRRRRLRRRSTICSSGRGSRCRPSAARTLNLHGARHLPAAGRVVRRSAT